MMENILQTQKRFQKAMDSFVERASLDRNILAVFLFGSLSYDTVWQKSDIDLIIVTTEKSKAEKKASVQGIALVEDEVNIHALLKTRSDFKKMLEGSLQNSFMHSCIAKSKLLFTRDETLKELYQDLHAIGGRDKELQLFRAAVQVLPCLYKAEKFCHIKQNPHYSYLWLSYAYTGLAQIESYLHNRSVDREVLHQALELNPTFFKAIYTDLLDKKKTISNISKALQQVDDYLTKKVHLLFRPILDYLQDAGEIRSATEIDQWLHHQLGVSGAVTACEWLADKEIILKASSPRRLTSKSQIRFHELAFYYGGEMPEGEVLP